MILLDLSTRDNVALPRRMRSIAPNLRYVAFAVTEEDVLVCAEAGVCGYVPQNGSIDDLIEAVLRAVKDELVCPPQIAALLFRRLAALSPHPDRVHDPLTRREKEIAGLIAHGLPNKEIARRLRLAPATIKNHVHNILQKLNLQRRGELAARKFADMLALPSLRDGKPVISDAWSG